MRSIAIDADQLRSRYIDGVDHIEYCGFVNRAIRVLVDEGLLVEELQYVVATCNLESRDFCCGGAGCTGS